MMANTRVTHVASNKHIVLSQYTITGDINYPVEEAR